MGLTAREDLELVALLDEVMNLPKFHGFMRVSNALDGEPFPISTIRFGYRPRRPMAPGWVPLTGPDPVDSFFARLATGSAPSPPRGPGTGGGPAASAGSPAGAGRAEGAVRGMAS
jgi:hypothetical protein